MPDYSGILKAYKSQLTDEPSCLVGWRRLAHAYELYSNFNESLPIWTRLVEIDPLSLDSRVRLSTAQLSARQYKKARESITVAKEIHPHAVMAQFYYAWTIHLSFDLPSTITKPSADKSFCKVVTMAQEGECRTDIDYSLAAYASYISSYKDYDPLISKWNAAFPVSSLRCNSLGVRACDDNDFTSAERHFKEGVKSNPYDLNVLRNLVELFVFKVKSIRKENYWLKRLREVEEWHFNPARILHD